MSVERVQARELRRRVRKRLARARERTAAWLAAPSAEHTHALRTSLRRLRIALSMLPGKLRERRRARSLARAARALFRACSALRDADVLTTRARTLPQPVGSALVARVEGERARWMERARRRAEALLEAKPPALPKRALGDAALARRATKVVGELGRIVRRQLPAALRQDEPPETLHDVRKAAKSLRYAYELVTAPTDPAHPSAVDPIAWARALQDALGELHDLDVLLAQLEALDPVAGRNELLEATRAQRASKLEELAVFVRRTPTLLSTIAPVA